MSDQIIEKLLATTENAVADFQKSLPGIQKGLLDEITLALKDLQTVSGKILNNVDNLKLINKLRNKIERLIVSEGYKDQTKDFVKSFDIVEALQLQYFAQFNQKFKPNQTLPIIKTASIDKTLNDLLGQGLQSNVVDKLYDVLSQNTTTGGSYASMVETLRTTITGGPGDEGLLQRYGKTITTDAVNQYSAQYHDTLAQDLNFNWGRYIGSNITTTREFCEFLTKKQWVHRSELPLIIEGMIDGHQCKVNKKGLPLGMIPGTDQFNFKIRRGGYNCGHQFFYVPDSSVPKDIVNKFKTPEEVKTPVASSTEPTVMNPEVKKLNAAAFKKLEKKNIPLWPEIFNSLPDQKLKVVAGRAMGAWYMPADDTITIGSNPGREKSQYFRDTIIPHELGHAIHNKNDIITTKRVSPEFKEHFDSLKEIMGDNESATHDVLWNKYKEAGSDQNKREQVTIMFDILGSLSEGNFGGGHSPNYYTSNYGAEKEIFAHGISLSKVDNEFSEITPELKKIVDAMKKYASKFLK